MNPFRKSEGVEAHHISATRLWGIVLLFILLSSYAVWRSERFQNLIQGVSQSRLTAALGRPVTFQTVEFRVFPPSLRLANVRVANDPRLSGEVLFAEEVSIGGGVSLVGQELRLGRIRAVRPRIALVQFEDGTWNLPPGLAGSAKKGQGGVSVKIGSILIQEGLFELEGRRIHVDGRFEDFAAELVAIANNRYRGTLVSRRATLRLPTAEPLVAGISARFRLDPESGVSLDDLRLQGRFGRLRASGTFEKAGRTTAVLQANGEVSIEEIERIFHANLGFAALSPAQFELHGLDGRKRRRTRRRVSGASAPHVHSPSVPRSRPSQVSAALPAAPPMPADLLDPRRGWQRPKCASHGSNRDFG